MQTFTFDALAALRAALLSPAPERDAAFERGVMAPLRPLWEPGLRMMGPRGAEVDGPLAAARLFRFYRPELGAERAAAALDRLDAANTVAACSAALRRAVDALDPEGHGLALPGANLAVVLADPDGLDPRLDGYTGVGNVPGWSLVLVWPTDFNLPRLPAIVMHEFHHHVRRAVAPGFPMELGEYLVLEGLAEAFAARHCGEDRLGRWTTALDGAALAALRPRFADALFERDFGVVRGYIFGDWSAAAAGHAAHGLPDFAGYAMGYGLVKAALARTGLTPEEATFRPWTELAAASGWFDAALAARAGRP